MRKFLTVSVLLLCLIATIFFVGCDPKTETVNTPTQQTTPADTTTSQDTSPAFTGTAFDAFKALETKGTITMEYSTTEQYGAFISKITYDGFTMGDVGYPMVYVNKDTYRDPLQSMGNDYTYKGETFYASSMGISFIEYTAGMKILIVYTEEVAPGTYTYAVKEGDALLFTLPNTVEKVTLGAEEVPFTGTAFDAFKALETKGTITMEYSTTEQYGAFISKITYDGFTMGDVGYPMVYVNKDTYRDPLQSMGNDYTYKGETFYASSMGISFIEYTAGMKILIVYTEEVAPGTYTYAVKSGSALLFTLPNKVEKVTLD